LKTLLIVLIVGAVIGLSGFGVLANDVVLDVQKLGVFPSIDTFVVGGFGCVSAGGGPIMYFNDTDIEEGTIQDTSHPFYNPHAKMICEWESHLLGYNPPPPPVYYGEGCSADFWSTHKDKWPQGYEPDNKYNEFFQTTYYLSAPWNEGSSSVTTVEGDYDDDDDGGNGGDDDDDGGNGGDNDDDGGNGGDNDDNGGDDDDDGGNGGDNDDEGDSGDEGDYGDSDHTYGPTLQEALEIQGVGYDSLIRESVAALLNAASDDVEYRYSAYEVITMTQKALLSGDYIDTQNDFVNYNNNQPGSPLCPSP